MDKNKVPRFLWTTLYNSNGTQQQNHHTIAWRSTCGFQSESMRMTTSAVARLIPRPPALVLSMKMNLLLPGALYSLIDF